MLTKKKNIYIFFFYFMSSVVFFKLIIITPIDSLTLIWLLNPDSPDHILDF